MYPACNVVYLQFKNPIHNNKSRLFDGVYSSELINSFRFHSKVGFFFLASLTDKPITALLDNSTEKLDDMLSQLYIAMAITIFALGIEPLLFIKFINRQSSQSEY